MPTPRSRIELLATIVLSGATILTAWSGFQSAKWSGIQARSFSEAAATRSESVRASTAAGQQAVVDASVFTSWLTAHEQGDDRVAGLIASRFRDEFAVAFDEWLSMDPLTDPDAPPTPFALPSYQLEAVRQAEELGAEASTAFGDALSANQRSDNYVLMTVMTAGVLFLAAISTRLDALRLQWVVLATATTGLLALALVTATFPMEI